MSCGPFWIVRLCCIRQADGTPIGIYYCVVEIKPTTCNHSTKKVCHNTNCCIVNNSDAMKL